MVVHKSPYHLEYIPQVNILSYLFPPSQPLSDEPLWIDAIHPETNSLSPAQTLSWIRRTALGLHRLGLRRGDVVMMLTPNHIFVPVVYLATTGAGFIFTGANPSFTRSELVYQMTDTAARVLLIHPQLVDIGLAAASDAGIPQSHIFLFSDGPYASLSRSCDALVEAPSNISDWRIGLVAAPGADAEAYRWPELTAKEAQTTIATVNYSSGTTGLPKGVCVTHSNLVANVEQAMVMLYAHTPYASSSSLQRPAERWIGFLPLYHAYGQVFMIITALRLGHVRVYVMAAFRYEEFLASIVRFRITSLQVVPPILVMLSKRRETKQYDLSSVRNVLCAAAPLSRELQEDCERQFGGDDDNRGWQINQGWGMTEVTCGGTLVPRGIRDGSGSVGQLCPNSECRLVGEDGRDVDAPGEPGEIYYRGPQVCLGYWRNEQATRDSFDGDWFKTGDIAVCDDKGFFWIVDRKKELIKVNALQVSPAELEGVLLENEHVADAAVVGIIIDNEEFPRAYVVLKDQSHKTVSATEIQAWIAERVAKHKRLTGGVVIVNEVPKLASGKIQRKVMRAWAKRDAVEARAIKGTVTKANL